MFFTVKKEMLPLILAKFKREIIFKLKHNTFSVAIRFYKNNTTMQWKYNYKVEKYLCD